MRSILFVLMKWYIIYFLIQMPDYEHAMFSSTDVTFIIQLDIEPGQFTFTCIRFFKYCDYFEWILISSRPSLISHQQRFPLACKQLNSDGNITVLIIRRGLWWYFSVVTTILKYLKPWNPPDLRASEVFWLAALNVMPLTLSDVGINILLLTHQLLCYLHRVLFEIMYSLYFS